MERPGEKSGGEGAAGEVVVDGEMEWEAIIV